MKKHTKILSRVWGILVLAILVVPVSGGLIIASDGLQITSTTGATSPVIQITGSPILAGGSIVIDVSTLRYCFRTNEIAASNIDVRTSAAAPVEWTAVVDPSGDTVTLTSSGGPTEAGNTTTVTFKGTATEPWISGSGELSFTVPVTRTDTSETAEFLFVMNTPSTPVGLSVTEGEIITSITGSTSPVITILDTPVERDGIITINVENLGVFLAGNRVSDANVQVHSSAVSPVLWTRSVSPDGTILTLTSTGGATETGETITVTFTGATNHWIPGVGGATLTATRGDTSDTADFTVQLDIPLPGDLMIDDGMEITSSTGDTTPVFTIVNQPVAANGTIIIRTAALNPYVAGGQLNAANVRVSDTAAAANWTASLRGDNLTLISTGGATAVNETVSVTFTGGGGVPWISDTGSARILTLTAVRGDSSATENFHIFMDIGGRPLADFTASPLSARLPAAIAFTDRSSKNPIAWNWSFGDGSYSDQQNPTHTYTVSGVYSIVLNATNSRGSGTRSKGDYIDIYNAGIFEANSRINGLVITNCAGPQSVSVNTSVLRADLIPNSSVLEIHPPDDRGFKNITIYSMNGIGFVRNGSSIIGTVTGVHLVSGDIAPEPGFSPDIGSNASMNWSADLPLYPCDAIVRTNIRERLTPENNAKLILIGNGQNPDAVPIGTAYSATITKINFPLSVPVIIHTSIRPGWRTSLDPTSNVFLWRISDDGNTGQILRTRYISTDTVSDLDFYRAGSPHGMSTFGLSSFTGNNNPFQLITLTVAAYIEPPQNPAVPQDNPNPTQKPTVSPTAIPTPLLTQNITPASGLVPESRTARVYTNADGLVTQATTLSSPDGFATISLDPGVSAKDSGGRPLASLTLSTVPGELPGPVPGGLFFTGRAYDLSPDGAVFSPAVLVSFAAPPDTKFGHEFSVMGFNRESGAWQEIPSSYNVSSGRVTARVPHFCCFGLFTREKQAGTAVVPPLTTVQPAAPSTAAPSTAISIVAGMLQWVTNLLAENFLAVAMLVAVIGGVVLYEWKQRRAWK